MSKRAEIFVKYKIKSPITSLVTTLFFGGPVHLLKLVRHFNKRCFGRRLCFHLQVGRIQIQWNHYFELLSVTDQ